MRRTILGTISILLMAGAPSAGIFSDEYYERQEREVARLAAEAAERERIRQADLPLPTQAEIRENAQAKASGVILNKAFADGIQYCKTLPPQYINVCAQTLQAGQGDILNAVYQAPDSDRVAATFDRCTSDQTISDDMARRPHLSPAILQGCVAITYAMETAAQR
jgi:type II secretory pathway pseudopilin PulG